MEIIFLGTSDMKPTAKRNHTAILLKHNAETVLVDCGEGTQRQFRVAGQNPNKLTRILITHWHGDHVLGLSGLLQTLAQENYSKNLYIYGPAGTKKYVKAILELFHFVGNIKMTIKEINQDGKVEEGEDFIIGAFKLNHNCPCLAYVFKEKDRIKIDMLKLKKFGIKNGPIIGQIQKGEDVKINGKLIKAKNVSYAKKGKKVAFIFDTVPCSGCYNVAKDADILIGEATFLHELHEKAAEYKHLTSEQIAEVAKKSRVRKLILTHLSQRYEKNPGVILKEAKRIFKNTLLAHDLMKVYI